MVNWKPTQKETSNACLYYRHDFGLLSEEERKSVMFEAREWLHSWKKAFEDKSLRLAARTDLVDRQNVPASRLRRRKGRSI